VQTPQIAFLVALFIAITVANSAILLSIVTSSAGRKSRMKFFIMHLAIAGNYMQGGLIRKYKVKPI